METNMFFHSDKMITPKKILQEYAKKESERLQKESYINTLSFLVEQVKTHTY